MLLICVLWSEDKVDMPQDTIEHWLSYFEKETFEKYVDEARLKPTLRLGSLLGFYNMCIS